MSTRVPLSISTDMVRTMAITESVCVRPVLRQVTDRATDNTTTVAIPCGSTRESICPSCATKARWLRMTQCAEGWHRDDEPEEPDNPDHGEQDDDDQLDDDQDDDGDMGEERRRVRSTRHRQDICDLPRVPIQNRTIGRTFTAPSGMTYRPSMFVTLTLPSYGRSSPDAASQPTQATMTTGAPHWMRCTSPSWSTDGCRTYAEAPGTRSSTSPASNPNAASPRTYTPPYAGRSPARSSRPSPRHVPATVVATV